MATLPHASVVVDPTSGAPGGGDDLVCILSPCVSLADKKVRQYGSAAQVVADHGYCEGVEYAAMHASITGLPFLFVGLPIGTLGAVSRFTQHENSGSSVVSVTAGSDGVLAEHDGVIDVVTGGTIGTSQIKLNLSLDGGRTFQPVRLGTANSYALPNVGVTVSFGAGTLVAEDRIAEWHGSAPRITPADLAEVRAQWAAGLRTFRSALLCGDLPDAAAASSFVTQLNAYATENDRHIFARASVGDRLPQAQLSHSYARMTGAPSLTFATSDDGITRAAGSWVADGFFNGDTAVISGTSSNNGSFVIDAISAAEIETPTNLTDEVAGAATVTGGPTLVFSASADTITRNRGSWLADGFRVGTPVEVEGSASNDGAHVATAVTALVLTVGNTLADETILASLTTIVGGQTKAAWMAAQDAEYADVSAEPRLRLSAGRGSSPSTYSGWHRRIPANWFASVREYTHDLHIPTWRKDLGPVGANLFDANNDLVEWDDRIDGEAGSAAGFTTLRTWANGPRGGFIALDLTRAEDGKIESMAHNHAVICKACNVVQLATENVIGRTLQLNSDGTATKESLNVIQGEVNAALDVELLSSRGEGPRASSAVWTPAADDLYNIAEPLMNGVLTLLLNGTVHSVATRVRVQTNG